MTGAHPNRKRHDAAYVMSGKEAIKKKAYIDRDPDRNRLQTNASAARWRAKNHVARAYAKRHGVSIKLAREMMGVEHGSARS